MVKFIESKTQPDPVTCKYWVDLFENPYGGSIKYFNGKSWVKVSDESADLSSIKNQLSNKVDKVSGKDLSTNDYTTTEKQKLAGIANNANNYVLPTASNNAKGGIQLGYTASGKNYPLLVDSSGKAYVTVNWTDTKVTINNTLTSTSTTEALSAAQGKALKDALDALTARVAALEAPAA